MPELPRIYWDACVALSYVNRVEDRMPDLEWYLERSGKEFQLITSAISVVEVAFALQEQTAGVLDQAVEDAISNLWAPDSAIQLVEFYPLIGDEARAFIRAGLPLGWRLKPLDAIHLATARRIGAKEFHTYDTGLFKYAAAVGAPIKTPLAQTPELPFASGPPEAIAAEPPSLSMPSAVAASPGRRIRTLPDAEPSDAPPPTA